MLIEKLSDLEIGQIYYLWFFKDSKKAKRIKFLGLLNETVAFKSDRSEVYFEILKGKSFESRNLTYANEVGIGSTPNNAKMNYGKFNYEETEKAFNNYEKMRLKNEYGR